MGLLGQGGEEEDIPRHHAPLCLRIELECGQIINETLHGLDLLRRTPGLCIFPVPDRPLYGSQQSDQKCPISCLQNLGTEGKGRHGRKVIRAL